MLVVAWVDAEAGHKAVDHQVHVSTLAPGAPGERLCRVEQESLRGHTCMHARADTGGGYTHKQTKICLLA